MIRIASAIFGAAVALSAVLFINGLFSAAVNQLPF